MGCVGGGVAGWGVDWQVLMFNFSGKGVWCYIQWAGVCGVLGGLLVTDPAYPMTCSNPCLGPAFFCFLHRKWALKRQYPNPGSTKAKALCIARSLGDMQWHANIGKYCIILGCNRRAWATVWVCVNKELPLIFASFKFQDASTKTFSLPERPEMHGNAS